MMAVPGLVFFVSALSGTSVRPAGRGQAAAVGYKTFPAIAYWLVGRPDTPGMDWLTVQMQLRSICPGVDFKALISSTKMNLSSGNALTESLCLVVKDHTKSGGYVRHKVDASVAHLGLLDDSHAEYPLIRFYLGDDQYAEMLNNTKERLAYASLHVPVERYMNTNQD